MSERTIRLHTFCSVKGGVGKTTLAIVCAKVLATQGRVPVLIDCDLTGTSLADGLNLRAPKVAVHEDGSIDFEAAPTGEWLSVEDSRSLILRRQGKLQEGDWWKDHPHPPPFLNDILLFVANTQRTPNVQPFFWCHKDDDRIRYIPSSSLLDDVKESIVWLYDEPFAWTRVFVRVLDALAKQIPDLTDVIVDLPPGTWGFSHEMLSIVSLLLHRDEGHLPPDYALLQEGAVRWEPNPFMVSSRDPNDFVPAFQYVVRHQDLLPTLQPLVNRSEKSESRLLEKMKGRLPSILWASGVEKKLKVVGPVDAFARLFWDGDIKRAQIPEGITKTLRLQGNS